MHVETRALAATGHTAGSAVEENRVEPMCTLTGKYDSVVYCSVCKKELSRESVTIPATGHSWGEWAVTTPATCEGEGVETRVCANDPTHVETRPIDAIGHNFGEWTVVTPATCFDEGLEQRVCANDPTHVETRAIPQLVPALGDVNGDEKLNSRDVIALMRLLTGWDDADIFPESADLDGNGRLNARDVIALMKAIVAAE